MLRTSEVDWRHALQIQTELFQCAQVAEHYPAAHYAVAFPNGLLVPLLVLVGAGKLTGIASGFQQQ